MKGPSPVSHRRSAPSFSAVPPVFLGPAAAGLSRGDGPGLLAQEAQEFVLRVAADG